MTQIPFDDIQDEGMLTQFLCKVREVCLKGDAQFFVINVAEVTGLACCKPKCAKMCQCNYRIWSHRVFALDTAHRLQNGTLLGMLSRTSLKGLTQSL